MNTGENIKILDNDLLQQVDLDEWEVINENKIITKNKENNIQLENLTETYKKEIEKSCETDSSTPKANYKKKVNLTIEIPKIERHG